MRSLAASILLLLASTLPCLGQAHFHSGSVGATYQWTHTNTLPGRCGCFSLNGGGLFASLGVAPRLEAAAEVSAGYQNGGPLGPGSLTLVSYLGGLRYMPKSPWHNGPHTPQLFAQALAGAAHAGGTISGQGDHHVTFAGRVGGGVDVPLAGGFVVRLAQVDYFATTFANTSNNHQNNLMVGAGLLYRWSR